MAIRYGVGGSAAIRPGSEAATPRLHKASRVGSDRDRYDGNHGAHGRQHERKVEAGSTHGDSRLEKLHYGFYGRKHLLVE